MPNRVEVEHLLRELYDARLAGDLERMCRTFTDDARLEIAGASYATPIAIRASGIADIRTWLAPLVKTIHIGNQEILSMIIEDTSAAVHWQSRIRSRVTGTSVLTDLMDMIRVRNGRIESYIEFFVPR
jgi:ketosteroid isomerase-like protein